MIDELYIKCTVSLTEEQNCILSWERHLIKIIKSNQIKTKQKQLYIMIFIFVEMMASSLSSLKSSHSVNTLKMKLTKKRVPCLTFEIELVG